MTTMRELYACQLDLHPSTSETADVQQLVSQWAARGSGASAEQLLTPGDTLTPLGHRLSIEQVVNEDGRAGWTCSWLRPDDVDSSLQWRVMLAIGALPEEPALVRVTVRIALERAHDAFRLAPARYDFASPTIVRTLLREHRMLDAGIQVKPLLRERRAADVTQLVDLLLSTDRRLPVLVLTRHPTAGHLIDGHALAKQLAGLAHVQLLTTHLAALALTDTVGKQFSVWGGAARLYWPGFSLEDDPRHHRLWTATRLLNQDDFIARTRSWLGTAAAAAVPEHPTVTAAKENRRHTLAKTDELPKWINDYITHTDAELEAGEKERNELMEALANAQQVEQDAHDALADMRRQFNVMQAATQGDPEKPNTVDFDGLSVLDAFHLARNEAGAHVTYLDAAENSVQNFSTYENPRRLYEALSTLDEAAEAWQDGTLGPGFGAYFSDRGYEYSQKVTAAFAHRTKAQYQRSYDGRTVTIGRHLKVDQATSPDQCLRVYWHADEQKHRLVVGHVGRHLPD